uniref:TNFR-Cys domain-containing protein n=1 Tax=Castor canadensis TaxID=51338 RepID=A0A8C0ZRL4_CASCN
MGRGYYSVVTAVLLVMNLERTGSMRASCGHCEAGTFCGTDKSHLCSPCPPSSYSSSGGQRACNICTRCEGHFRIKKACSPTHDAECECISGFHCLGSECTKCEPDCKQGQELTKDGCKDCGPGMFNDQEGGTCRHWTNCSWDGKSVLRNGTKENDVLCGPHLASFSPGTSPTPMPAPEREPRHSPQILTFFVALMSAAVLFLLFFLVLWLSVVKWSRKKFLYIFKQRKAMRDTSVHMCVCACVCRLCTQDPGREE